LRFSGSDRIIAEGHRSRITGNAQIGMTMMSDLGAVLWNISGSYVCESEAYPCVIRRNIPQASNKISLKVSGLL